MKLNLKIITPERIVLDEEVDQVSLPATDGEITILPNHVPLITSLASGEIVAINALEIIPMAVVGGLVEIKNNQVSILADFAEHVEEIGEEEIVKAKERAEKLRREQGKVSKEDFEHFEGELEKSLTRVKIAEKWRSKTYRKLNIKSQG